MKNQSPVPKEKYAKEYKIQLKQLKKSNLLKRFAKSRKKLEINPYRPYYHFVSPECKMHDANGLCFYKGKWHLFYQAFPPEYPIQHWGHAVSIDLINWKDLPYAIYPGPEKACFSGATLVEENRVIAMYHGTSIGNMIAISKDDLLLNWEKIINGAVIDIDNKNKEYQVFDPCIWKKEDVYYSLSGGFLPYKMDKSKYRAAEFLFKSKDLINWEYMHPFVEEDIFTLLGDDGACPYFWPIDNKYILLFFSHMSGGQALIGEYDKKRDKFISKEHIKANHGVLYDGGVHAPSATPDGEGGVIVIHNVNSGKEQGVMRSVMTLPRKLSFENNKLTIQPTGNFKSLRYNHRHINETKLIKDKKTSFEDVKGNTIELIMEIDVKNTNFIEIEVLQSEKESTKIRYYHKRGYNRFYRRKEIKRRDSVLEIDSSHSTVAEDVLTRPIETMQVELNDNETLKLHIFIDKSIVEVFVNNKDCASVRVYPKHTDSIGISIMSKGKDAILKSLDIWDMKKLDYQI